MDKLYHFYGPAGLITAKDIPNEGERIKADNLREQEKLMRYYSDRQSDKNKNCTVSSHNMGLRIRVGEKMYQFLLSYELSHVIGIRENRQLTLK